MALVKKKRNAVSLSNIGFATGTTLVLIKLLHADRRLPPHPLSPPPRAACLARPGHPGAFTHTERKTPLGEVERRRKAKQAAFVDRSLAMTPPQLPGCRSYVNFSSCRESAFPRILQPKCVTGVKNRRRVPMRHAAAVSEKLRIAFLPLSGGGDWWRPRGQAETV